MAALLKKNKVHHKAVIKAWKRQSNKLHESVKREKKLKVEVSVLEDKIKDISRIHEEEKRCLKLEMKRETDEHNQVLDQMEEEIDKHNQVLDQMKDKIECPVCMEVPRNSPVPVCPNGHFVCHKCKTKSCPTCRVAMGIGKSLLAGIVIDNIKHECRFVECEKTFSVDKLEDHEQNCNHRVVSCPVDVCQEKIALSKLINHFQVSKSKCVENSVPTVIHGSGIANFCIFSEQKLANSELHWQMKTYSFEDNIFAVIAKKLDNLYYFTMVMFGSKEHCCKYIIDMEVHERDKSSEDSVASYRFRGKPGSVDEDIKKVRLLGLSVNNSGMEQILRKGVDLAFSISFRLSKK